MKLKATLSLIYITGILTQACSTPYYGHTKEEWDSLTEKEKAAIKSEYKTVLDLKREQKHNDKIDAITDKIIKRGSDPYDRKY